MEEKEKVSDEKNKKGQKNNTFKVVLIAVLLVGLSAACGWCAHDYFSESKDSSQTNNNPSEEQVEEWKSLGTDISKVKDIYEFMDQYTYGKSFVNGGMGFSADEIANILYHKLILGKDLIIYSQPGLGKGFLDYDEANSTLKKLFGESYNFSTSFSGKFDCGTISDYDSTTNKFSIAIYPCGFGPSILSKNLRKVVNVYERSDEIKVVEKAIYFSDDYTRVYSDLEKTNLIDTLEISIEDYDKSFIDDYVEKASTITSLYRRANDGTYYFVSSETSK